MAEIVLEHISKRFPDGTTVLDDVSFSIHDGEFFILVGPSGCGKSTLLNLLAGLDDVSSGEIRLNGRIVNDLDPKERGMAMVFQSYALYPHMSVRGNIAFPLRMAKVSEADIERRVAVTAEILELGSILDRKPASLSGGQRQRVAMGRAIVREPEAFLLDEPLSNLDARLRTQMRGEIARLQKRLATTLIYVTHDQTEAMTLGDRVAVMHRGKLQQIGTPRELYQQPANLFVAGFIGSPAMNFLPAKRAGSVLQSALGSATLPHELNGPSSSKSERFIVGIRPEHFTCVSSGNEPPDQLTFEAIVDRVEWLGAELCVYFDPPNSGAWSGFSWPGQLSDTLTDNSNMTVSARLDPSTRIGKGEKVLLSSNLRKWHFFDPETGALLDESGNL